MIGRILLLLLLSVGTAAAQSLPPVTGDLPFTGASTTSPGVQGLVPAPLSADALAGNILGPGGGWTTSMPIQTAKTGSYGPVAESDNWTIIPVNCSAPCTVTFPHSTSSLLPYGSLVEIKNISSPAVAVTVAETATSTVYGIPLTNGNVVLGSTGDYVDFMPNSSNQYLASGSIAANNCGITQLTGAVTAGPGSGPQVATIANSGVSAGSYTIMNGTVGADGRLTAASNGTIPNTGVSPGSYTNLNATIGADGRITAASNGSGGGGGGSGGIAAGPNTFAISYNTGPLTALPGTAVGLGFVQVPISAAIDNIVLSTQAYTCTGAPTVSLRRCGTSSTCAASTSRGAGNPGTSAGTSAIVTVTDSAVPQGDYLAWMFTAGTCSVMNLEATAFLHANPGFCTANSQMAFTTKCNSAMQSLI